VSNLTTAERERLPEFEFLDPLHRTGVVVDQDDVDRAAAILGKFRDPAAARARLAVLAARKGLRLPPGVAPAAFAAAKYSLAQLAALLPQDYADMMGRKWPVLDQQDLDKCLAECPQAHEAGHPIHVQVLKLAQRKQLKLPDDFQAAAHAHFDGATAHAANFAHSDAQARAWDAAAGYAAGELAARVNARKRAAQLPPEPVPPRQPARPQPPPQGSVDFGEDTELAEARRKAAAFAQAANRRGRRPS
jgi:hypothetical protein